MADILIGVTDGLRGRADALGAVFRATTLQTCIVHLIRNSLDYASWKDRRALAAALKAICAASSVEAALAGWTPSSQATGAGASPPWWPAGAA